MNCSFKIALLFWCLMPVIFCGRLAMGMDIEDAPATVEIDYLVKLYEAVSFDHGMHTDMYGCGSCHHHTTGESPERDSCKKCHDNSKATKDVSCCGCHAFNETETAASPATTRDTDSLYHIDKPGLKGALHLQCLGCHRTEGGPTGCLDCHNFTAAGRKRFAVNK